MRTHHEPHHQGSNLGHSNLELVINILAYDILCFFWCVAFYSYLIVGFNALIVWESFVILL